MAKHAGFCYGVKRAYDMTIDFKENNPEKKVYTYGELIHNPQVLSKLEKKGIVHTENLDDTDSDLLVIRAHGVKPALIEEAKTKGYKIKDATCPYVKKIHILAKKGYDRGDFVLIIGDYKHPEVIGIIGNCEGRYKTIADYDEAKAFVEDYKNNNCDYPITTLAQTTYNQMKYKEIMTLIRSNIKNLREFDTICSATEDRQKELREMAEICDFIIVLGGKNSSNTRKLYEILRKLEKKAVHIENFLEIRFELFKNCDKIGIVAGASTPQESIEELVEYLLSSSKK